MVSSAIFSGEKKQHFVSYKHDDYCKLKSLDRMLLKTSTSLKRYDGETKVYIF